MLLPVRLARCLLFGFTREYPYLGGNGVHAGEGCRGCCLRMTPEHGLTCTSPSWFCASVFVPVCVCAEVMAMFNSLPFFFLLFFPLPTIIVFHAEVVGVNGIQSVRIINKIQDE